MVGERRLGVRVAALAAAIAMTGTALAACTPQPGEDQFYNAPAKPSVEAPAQHGDLVRYRPGTFTIDPVNLSPVHGVDTYQVMYRSTNVLGESNLVSGTVLVPTKPWSGEGSRPVVTVGVGTRGLGDTCAPSWTMTKGWDYEGYEYELMLRRGWAVAVSDMVGLGTPGMHTYTVGREQGTALLDIVRAAYQIPEAGLDADGPVGIIGYSQGGGSAGWAAELESTYTPELNVKGTAAAGVPADLLKVADALDGSPFIGLAMMAAAGYDEAYPDLDLGEFMNERGERMLEKSRDVCITTYDGVRKLVDVAGTWIRGYLTDPDRSPLEDPQWVKRLGENRLGSTTPAAPVMLQHAYFDQMVAFGQAETLRKEWCAAGANVTWRVHLLAEHVLGMVLSLPSELNFLAARFADKPVKGNC